MRTLVCEMRDAEGGCGGIIYKNKDGDIIDDSLSVKTVDSFCNNIKQIKKDYKRFILYRYDEEFHFYIYEEYPHNRSGVFRYFIQKYPNSVWDVMWRN